MAQEQEKLRERMNSLKPKLLEMLQKNKDKLDLVAFPMHTRMVEHPVSKELVERSEAIRLDSQENKNFLERLCRQFGDGRVEIRQTSDGGRGIFATKKIKKGQKISYERRPLICGSLSTDVQEYCDNCLSPLLLRSSKTSGAITTKKEWRIGRVDEVNVKKYHPNVVNCDSCVQSKFCSTECRDLAWHKWHRVLCGRSCATLRSYVALKNESQDNVSSNVKHPLLMIKVAAMQLAARERTSSNETPPPEVLQEIKMLDLLCGLNDSETRPNIEHIMSANVNDRELICEELGTLNDPLMDFRWFLDSRAVLQANNFHACPTVVKQPDREPFRVYNGIAVYGMSSFYNHSCSPNATADIDDKGGQLVVARKIIHPGEQIFISYCETGMSFEERQFDLLASYAFECNCEKCLNKQ